MADFLSLAYVILVMEGFLKILINAFEVTI